MAISVPPLVVHVPDAASMERLGARLAAAAGARGVLYLRGELGAGKTTLARGFLRGLGVQGPVKSPTFTLVEPYTVGDRRAYHFDLYRLAVAEELEQIGARDYFGEEALILVEWPERGGSALPVPDVAIVIERTNAGRTLTLTPRTDRGRTLVESVRVLPAS